MDEVRTELMNSHSWQLSLHELFCIDFSTKITKKETLAERILSRWTEKTKKYIITICDNLRICDKEDGDKLFRRGSQDDDNLPN